ncbi:ThiF family adenylyltransferase [Streptacidiphilus sp. EB103A]|uniref:HesA/MoeB/ThiF family protein n=1 Tax=Streptacidiphilus sp. EB103A TaxID=3156275 RepID=UPI00351531ED
MRIGGGVCGIAAEIRDPHGAVWAALELMDGGRTVAMVAERVEAHCPQLPPGAAARLVADLMTSGYIEDFGADDSVLLTEGERNRYRRNQAFFRYADLTPRSSAWEQQELLKQAGVLVLGAGGTGSHAAWGLVAAGVGRVHLLDHDRIELSNLTRQILYSEADLGRHKAEVAAERLRSVNSEVDVTFGAQYVASEAELLAALEGYDALALCADEPHGETLRFWTASACASLGIPWVGGGYQGPLVTVGVFGPGGPCIQCLARGEEDRLGGDEPAPYLGGAGSIAPTAGISGQLVAYEVIRLLTGLSSVPVGYLRGVNLVAPDHHVLVRHPARPDCSICGDRSGEHHD